MAKAFEDIDTRGHFLIECPACGSLHCFDTRWKFNGDLDNPTFSPSMLVTVPEYRDGRPTGKNNSVCHSFVRNGSIQFLNDCTHEMAGKTVELPECD